MTFTTPSFFADKMGVLVPVNNLSGGDSQVDHRPKKPLCLKVGESPDAGTGSETNFMDVASWNSDQPAQHFNGSDYSPAHDDARLTGQLLRVKQCMADGAWRTLAEIEAVTGDPQASISAQLRHRST